MWSVHQRMAEIWFIQKNRSLTMDEETEMVHCLEANMRKVQEVNKLKELSYLASTTNDTEWLHELCEKLDEIYGRYAL